MIHSELNRFLEQAAEEFRIPGSAVAVWHAGSETYASSGVTGVENPLAVDSGTLFQLGSITKTYTATALLRLVEDGRVDLDAPVVRYVPELRLKDEGAREKITPRRLLNHTAGLDWNLLTHTGDGDDALERLVRSMGELDMIGEPGERASYSQIGFNLIGRIIENATGSTYEEAVSELVLDPLSLDRTFFEPSTVMTHRFSQSHNPDEGGEPAVVRPWALPRNNRPGGGLVSSVEDQLKWARFQLGDGTAPDGTRLLTAATMRLMQGPTVELRASALGDAIGMPWFVRDIDGVRSFGHAGSSDGQYGDLLIVPEHDFAVVSVANANPGGLPFNRAVVRWTLERFLGVVDRDPEPLPYDADRMADFLGEYENDAFHVVIAEAGRKATMEVVLKPEMREAMGAEVPDYEPFSLGLLDRPGDEYLLTDGAFEGQRGFFTRGEDGSVTGVDLAGRLFPRVRG
ncbi:serine hydrolase domain-containing protein [Salininema proteolyticum]|uniref:Serine hydrolase domain-containing protein n=1 Tax=Salininema proteolyticum TaxID=1607685 RepID=A0ABV8U5F9_9ACTN